MKWTVLFASVFVLLLLAVLLHTPIRNILWVHPWLLSTLTGLPAIAIALMELEHSREANRLRAEANRLKGELDTERNKQLGQIAINTERPVTRAERNAEKLRKHLGTRVAVCQEHGIWGSPPEIVEVSEDNIVTLFTPRDYSSSAAWCVQVHCDDLEISDIPQGSCPLRIRVLRRYGPDVQLGEITRWGGRNLAAAIPEFVKGGVAYYATYSKPGSSETRSLYVYASVDGANSFLLEASTGERVVADNKEVSKRFMVLQIDYEAMGFQRSASGTGSSPYPHFIH